MLTTEKINELIDVNDSWKAPEKLLSTILDKDKRIQLFKAFLKNETDVSFDWFHMYFQDEAADRKKKKQDFTPQSISKLMNKLADNDDSDMYFEPAAGTGGIAKKCTKSELNDYLLDTNLTTDNFTPAEVLN